MKFQNSKTKKCTTESIRHRRRRKYIKSKLELVSFCALHGTTDTSRLKKALVTADEDCAVVLQSSKHGHGRLVLAKLDVPGMEYLGACAVIINQVLTTARRSTVCGRAARPHIDCVQSWGYD